MLLSSGFASHAARRSVGAHNFGPFRAGFHKLLTAVAFAVFAVQASAAFEASDSSESNQVIDAYLAATQSHQDQMRGASMEVNIDANIPSLKKQGRLRALRKISQLGKITYKVLGFQGDDTIKSEVIARYLDAEQKGQDNQKLAIIPANYKFKFKGLHKLQDGHRVYIVFLTPRKKEIGLFKGEMWLDSKAYLPVMESGKFVKNPSVFFKKVEFVRDYSIQNGAAIPQHMESTIDARLVGKVNLSVDYSRFQPGNGEEKGIAEPGAIPTAAAPSTIK